MEPEFSATHDKWQERFERAVKERDAAPEGTAHERRAQRRVSRCWNRMYSRGYFRDPYNDWSVLWKFGLSWWNDVIPRLDSDSNLQPAEAEWFRRELEEREAAFAAAVKECPAKVQKEYRRRYKALAAFLNEAISRNRH